MPVSVFCMHLLKWQHCLYWCQFIVYKQIGSLFNLIFFHISNNNNNKLYLLWRYNTVAHPSSEKQFICVSFTCLMALVQQDGRLQVFYLSIVFRGETYEFSFLFRKCLSWQACFLASCHVCWNSVNHSQLNTAVCYTVPTNYILYKKARRNLVINCVWIWVRLAQYYLQISWNC